MDIIASLIFRNYIASKKRRIVKKFFTAINCMDGRTQIPVINFLKEKYKVEFIDNITEPGPNLILSEQKKTQLLNSIFERVDISINKHSSKGIAVIGHYDCAGNPASESEQKTHLNKSLELLRSKYPHVIVTALWLNKNFDVTEL
jgi:ABC-type lipoprotein release transport system permease subunit